MNQNMQAAVTLKTIILVISGIWRYDISSIEHGPDSAR